MCKVVSGSRRRTLITEKSYKFYMPSQNRISHVVDHDDPGSRCDSDEHYGTFFVIASTVRFKVCPVLSWHIREYSRRLRSESRFKMILKRSTQSAVPALTT
jgi:hypothetical protein